MYSTNSSETQNLTDSYAELVSEKKKIEKSLNDYQTVDQKYNDSMIYVEQNRSQYMLWVAFAIFMGFYLLRIILFPDSRFNLFRMLFWFFLIMFFLISGLNMDKTHGFFLLAIIIILVVFINMNLIPSP